jgi:hypothetical protein
MYKHAELSVCRKYRYTLTRKWGEGDCLMACILVNPSTADHTNNDATTIRCMGFAERHGYDGLIMANLFAFRSRDPAMLKRNHAVGVDIRGPDNRKHLLDVVAKSSRILVGWGTGGGYLNADIDFMRWMREDGHDVHCLKITQDGYPAHPLYLRKDSQLIPYFGRQLAGAA